MPILSTKSSFLAARFFDFRKMTRRAAAFLSVLAPALFLGLAAAPPAALAQTIDVLVSNTGQTTTGYGSTLRRFAQAFTAGAATATAGYKLTSVDIKLQVASGDLPLPEYRVELWSASSGQPGAFLTRLENPDTLATGNNTFTAPGGGLDLTGGVAYHIVWIADQDNTTRAVQVTDTTADAEDTGAAAGWSIANASYYRSATTGWTLVPSTLQIAVSGYLKTAQMDAALSGLAVTDGSDVAQTLTPAFSSAGTAFTVTVENTVQNAKVTATVNSSGATLSGSLTKAGGTPADVSMTSGAATTLSSLAEGRNVLTITVTAQDGNTSTTYTLTVTRKGEPTVRIQPGDAQNLETGEALVLTALSSDPDGGALIHSWTATDSSNADVTMSVFVDAAFGTTYEEEVTFNAAAAGVYTVKVVVTDDENDTAEAMLTLTVTASVTASLSGLAVTDGSDNPLILTPAFSSDTTAYTLRNPIQNVKVTATASRSGSTLSGSLTKAGGTAAAVTVTSGAAVTLSDLAVGDNVLTVTVTAEDNSTEDYTLTITRTAAQDPTASITPGDAQTVTQGEPLTLTGTGEDPDGGAVSYSWAAVDAMSMDMTAALFPDGADMAAAVFTTTASTAAGDYTVTLTVTDDEDVAATATLAVTVRVKSNDATLNALTAMGGDAALTLSPAFASATTAYTATVGDAVTSVEVTATATDMAAALAGSLTRAGGTAEDVGMTSGAAATLADLAPGGNVLTVTVTAEDGTIQTYTLTLTRQLAPTLSVSPAGDQHVAPDTDLVLTATASDPDGGAVTYAWTAMDSGAMDATAAVLSGAATATATFNAAMPGAYTVTVTVTDDESQTASASLTVTVALETEMRAKAVTKVLAAAGLRTLSGVLDNVGARMGGGMPGPSLTLAGENVPLGAASSAGLACEPDVFGRDECAGGMRGASGLDLFGSSAFSLAAGASGGAMAEPGSSVRLALWGRGDAGTFEGSPEGMSYEGKTRTGWLGVDVRADRWVAGVALSRGETEADYAFDAAGGHTGAGRLETDLTSVFPYGRWSFAEGTELRGVVGAGIGEARHRPKEGGAAAEKSELTMWMASAGVRRAFHWTTAGIVLAARGDVSFVQMETGDGGETIDGLTAQGWRGRAGVEGSSPQPLPGGGVLGPFVEAGVRQDSGDGLEGAGVELAGGVRISTNRIFMEARGRWLVAHTEEGVKERGVSATVRLNSDSLGRGVSLALTPRWGSPADGSGALWKDDLPRPGSAAAAETSVNAELGYGVGMPRGALLTPFVETGVAENRRFRVGARYEAWRALSLEVSGERRESATTAPEHAVGLDFRLLF